MTYTQVDPAPVLELIDAFRRSKTMFTAVSMGVFDRLAGRSATAQELAAELGAHVGGLERLLDGCAGIGLLLKTHDTYANSPAAERYLRRDSLNTLSGYIRYSDKVLFSLWGDLEGAVREGTNRWRAVFGGGDGALFTNFFSTEEAKRDFLAGMHGFGLLSSPALARAFDLSGLRRLVDLGGGTGHLARAIADAYPGMRAAVFDLPEVIETAREYLEGSTVELIAGDFFTGPLPEADLYALSRILHDWSDDGCMVLLRKVFDALPSGGALLIAEKLLDEDGCGPVPAQMQSLSMLVCTEGRERKVSEFAALLQAAGFTDIAWKRTGCPVDAMLARKA